MLTRLYGELYWIGFWNAWPKITTNTILQNYIDWYLKGKTFAVLRWESSQMSFSQCCHRPMDQVTFGSGMWFRCKRIWATFVVFSYYNMIGCWLQNLMSAPCVDMKLQNVKILGQNLAHVQRGKHKGHISVLFSLLFKCQSNKAVHFCPYSNSCLVFSSLMWLHR